MLLLRVGSDMDLPFCRLKFATIEHSCGFFLRTDDQACMLALKIITELINIQVHP